jgi:predicted NUDIX family NTP pyrophosphohydrolase
MPKISAGLLMYRITSGKPQVLLVHLGGQLVHFQAVKNRKLKQFRRFT